MSGEDFVFVQLSGKGEDVAAGHPLILAGSRYQFEFRPGEVKRVTKAFDWGCVLSRAQRDGEPLFELAPEPANDNEGDGGLEHSNAE